MDSIERKNGKIILTMNDNDLMNELYDCKIISRLDKKVFKEAILDNFIEHLRHYNDTFFETLSLAASEIVEGKYYGTR